MATPVGESVLRALLSEAITEAERPRVLAVAASPKWTGKDVLETEAFIRALGRARLINAIEVEELRHALKHLLEVRMRLALLGFPHDILPENPDKLDRLAHVSGFEDGNAFLRTHEAVIERVREIYQEGMERLRA